MYDAIIYEQRTLHLDGGHPSLLRGDKSAVGDVIILTSLGRKNFQRWQPPRSRQRWQRANKREAL